MRAYRVAYRHEGGSSVVKITYVRSYYGKARPHRHPAPEAAQ